MSRRPYWTGHSMHSGPRYSETDGREREMWLQSYRNENDLQRAARAEVTTKPLRSDDKIEKNEERGRCCRIFLRCLSIFVKLFLGFWICVFTVCAYCKIYECCFDIGAQANMTGLSKVLKQNVYGQHLVIDPVLHTLEAHIINPNPHKPLVMFLHGWTGSGKNFVSSIIANHLFAHGSKSRFVHKIIVSLDFPHSSQTARYRDDLRKRILNAQSACGQRQLFVFDEMDKIPHGIIDGIIPFLGRNAGNVEGVDFRKSVFIFISNTWGGEINELVVNHYKLGNERKSLTMDSVYDSVYKFLKEKPINDAWFQPLAESNVFDLTLPFLPLERRDVLLCIKSDMERKGHVYSSFDLEKVANELMYFPGDSKLFSVSGCKKVSRKVDLIME